MNLPPPVHHNTQAAHGGLARRPKLPSLDQWINAAEATLRTLSGGAVASRPMPQPNITPDSTGDAMPEDARKLSGALMRVNHVGEVCAQALYQGQALLARTPEQRAHLQAAAREEIDHLAWTQTRLDALGARPSLLNPVWYAGAFGIGLLAAAISDKMSLGFVVETERQVEAHLASHLDQLPPEDAASRAVVAAMQSDEARHAADATHAGAADLPSPLKALMGAAAKVMTSTAHRI
jgi:3-demethoxyubiquinol 3-hydroxylase